MTQTESHDLESRRAVACLDTLSQGFRMAMREGGKNARMHVGDVLRIIEAFQRGDMDEGAPITGPFDSAGNHLHQ